MSVPRVVIAAPSSGAGKTTVATGLMAALTAARAAGQPAQGRAGLHRPRLPRARHRAARPQPRPGDGRRGPDRPALPARLRRCGHRRHRRRHGPVRRKGRPHEGSTAHVAALLDAPVILVVDASSQSRSVAALVHGFASFDPAVRFAGVILNRVASDRHEQVLRESLRGVPVLGVLRRDAAISHAVSAPRAGTGGRAVGRGARDRRAARCTGRRRRWTSLRSAGSPAQPGIWRARPGHPLLARPRAPWSLSRGARRSPSPTPS